MMSNDDTKRGSGILNSLKKLIFEDDQPQQNQHPQTPSAPAPNAIPNTPYKEPSYSPAPPTTGKTPPPIPITANDGTTDLKEMKLKVYAILEKLNEQGVDFFEVWNAAAAMGKVEENTLKAAYTSLKFVDSSLSKEKLIATAQIMLINSKKPLPKNRNRNRLKRKKLNRTEPWRLQI